MKNINLASSFRNAINGLLYCILHERNMRIHIIAAVSIFILGFLLDITRFEFAILSLTMGFVIVCEFMNTAIEVMADLMVQIYHPKVEIIKDVAAGAVMLSALISIIVGYFIFFDKIKVIFINLLSFIM